MASLAARGVAPLRAAARAPLRQQTRGFGGHGGKVDPATGEGLKECACLPAPCRPELQNAAPLQNAVLPAAAIPR